MSKKINDIIRLAYEPPEPLEKERFLAGFREAPIGHPEFVLRQYEVGPLRLADFHQ